VKPTLYYLFQSSCKVCRAQKPIVDRFEREHPEVEVVRLNADPKKRSASQLADDFPVSMLPAFGLHAPGRERDGRPLVTLREGMVETPAELAAWCRACTSRSAV